MFGERSILQLLLLFHTLFDCVCYFAALNVLKIAETWKKDDTLYIYKAFLILQKKRTRNIKAICTLHKFVMVHNNNTCACCTHRGKY